MMTLALTGQTGWSRGGMRRDDAGSFECCLSFAQATRMLEGRLFHLDFALLCVRHLLVVEESVLLGPSSYPYYRVS